MKLFWSPVLFIVITRGPSSSFRLWRWKNVFVAGHNSVSLSVFVMFTGICPSPIRNRDVVTLRSWQVTDDEYIIVNFSVKHPVRRLRNTFQHTETTVCFLSAWQNLTLVMAMPWMRSLQLKPLPLFYFCFGYRITHRKLNMWGLFPSWRAITSSRLGQTAVHSYTFHKLIPKVRRQ